MIMYTNFSPASGSDIADKCQDGVSVLEAVRKLAKAIVANGGFQGAEGDFKLVEMTRKVAESLKSACIGSGPATQIMEALAEFNKAVLELNSKY